MTKVLTAIKLLLADVAQLQTPVIASAVAGAVVSILGLFGDNIPVGAVLGVVAAVGGAAGVIEKIVTGQADPAPAPAPPAPPAPVPPATSRKRDGRGF